VDGWTDQGNKGNKMATKIENREQFIEHLKRHMPETYKAVQAKAKEIGKEAYAMAVRGAVKGEAGCFYAIEGGHVVGTPIGMGDVMHDLAVLMVQWGVDFVCVWGKSTAGVQQ
jgi:hypothetical protein